MEGLGGVDVDGWFQNGRYLSNGLNSEVWRLESET